MFGKSQRYLAVLQKVSDLEVRLEAVKTDVDRNSLAHQVTEVHDSAADEEIAEEIEKRFAAVLRENIPTLVSEVQRRMEGDWDLEAVIGKEVFRLLENHLPELTAKELTEEEVAAVTEEVGRRVRRDVESMVESKVGQLIPLVEKENSSSALDEVRPRIDQVTEGMRRVWEEIARLKMGARKIGKRLDAIQGKVEDTREASGSRQIPEQLMGRASIEDIVKERVQEVIGEKGTDSERRMAAMEDRLTRLSKVLEKSNSILKPTAPRVTRPARSKTRSRKERDAALDEILNTQLRIVDR